MHFQAFYLLNYIRMNSLFLLFFIAFIRMMLVNNNTGFRCTILYISCFFQPVVIYFNAQAVPVLTTESASESFCYVSYPSLSTFLLSSKARCSRFMLSLYPSPGISHFSKEPWFLPDESGI